MEDEVEIKWEKQPPEIQVQLKVKILSEFK